MSLNPINLIESNHLATERLDRPSSMKNPSTTDLMDIPTYSVRSSELER